MKVAWAVGGLFMTGEEPGLLARRGLQGGAKRLGGPYSTFAPESFTTFAHFTISARW